MRWPGNEDPLALLPADDLAMDRIMLSVIRWTCSSPLGITLYRPPAQGKGYSIGVDQDWPRSINRRVLIRICLLAIFSILTRHKYWIETLPEIVQLARLISILIYGHGVCVCWQTIALFVWIWVRLLVGQPTTTSGPIKQASNGETRPAPNSSPVVVCIRRTFHLSALNFSIRSHCKWVDREHSKHILNPTFLTRGNTFSFADSFFQLKKTSN